MERVKLDNRRILFNLLPAHVAQHFLMSNPRNMVSRPRGRVLAGGLRGWGPRSQLRVQGVALLSRLCLKSQSMAISEPSVTLKLRVPLFHPLGQGVSEPRSWDTRGTPEWCPPFAPTRKHSAIVPGGRMAASVTWASVVWAGQSLLWSQLPSTARDHLEP